MSHSFSPFERCALRASTPNHQAASYASEERNDEKSTCHDLVKQPDISAIYRMFSTHIAFERKDIEKSKQTYVRCCTWYRHIRHIDVSYFGDKLRSGKSREGVEGIVYKQIRKKHIIAGVLELPQPGTVEKLLLELPDGGRVARGELYYRTACACLWELCTVF